MEYFKVWLLFVRCIVSYCFLPPKTKYALAGRKLFTKSFRYKNDAGDNVFFFLKYFLKALLLRQIKVGESVTIYNKGGGVFFYDLEPYTFVGGQKQDNEKFRLTHINYFSKEKVNGAIWKTRLLGYYSVADKCMQFIMLTLLFPFLIPFACFKKYRASASLLFFEYVELVNLLKIAKRNSVKSLFYYSIYEKDSNISAIALQSVNIYVVKVASLTPLKFWNNIVIADKLVVNTFQQLEETKIFKDTILAKEIELWGPDENVKVFDRYTLGMYELNKNVIGYYSTASYIRALENDLDIYNTSAGESITMTYIAEYIQKHPGIRLVVFPHPREKNEKYKKSMEEYYARYFKGIEYKIMLDTQPSAYYFEEANVGIAFYSSVIFERLYFGFKSMLFTPPDSKVNVLELRGNKMYATTKEELFSRLDMFLPMSNHEYFKFVETVSPILNKLTASEISASK